MEIGTFVFYLFLMLVIMASYQLKWKSYNWFAITILTLVLGLRGCGIDTPGYIELFHYYINVDASLFNPTYYDPSYNPMYESDVHTEWLYLFLFKFIKLFSHNSVWFFLIIDFFTFLLLDKFISKYDRNEKFWIVFFFFTTLVFIQMFNTMRQFLAIMILLNMVDYLKERQWKQYFFFVAVLYLCIHKSAIMLAPFYFFIHFDIFKSKLFQYVLYFSVVAFSVAFIDQLKTIMDALYFVADGTDYVKSSYLNSETQLLKMEVNPKTIFLYGSAAVYVIIHSAKFKEAYGKAGIIMYNFAFIGLLIMNITYNRGVARMNDYFYSFLFVVLGLMAYQSFNGYYKNKSIMTIFTISLGLLYIAWFANAVLKGAAGCAPYIFNIEL